MYNQYYNDYMQSILGDDYRNQNIMSTPTQMNSTYMKQEPYFNPNAMATPMSYLSDNTMMGGMIPNTMPPVNGRIDGLTPMSGAYPVTPMMTNAVEPITMHPNMGNTITPTETEVITTPADMKNIEEIEDCYPETYKIVFPMIVKRCEMNNLPITEDLVEKITDEIYFSIEPRENTRMVEEVAKTPVNMAPSMSGNNVNTNTKQTSRPNIMNNNVVRPRTNNMMNVTNMNKNISSNVPEIKLSNKDKKETEIIEISETRSINYPIRDLVKILVLRQLLDGRFPGHRHDHRHRRPSWNRPGFGPRPPYVPIVPF